MKRISGIAAPLSAAIVVLAFYPPVSANPTASLSLDPASGAIAGQPGETIGFGFTLTSNSTDWISVTSSALTFETNPSLGTFTDFIGLQGGPSPSFALAPLASWSEVFDGTSQGIGSYALDSGAIPFSQNTGQIEIAFDIFNADPSQGGTQIASDIVSAPFSITVEPEVSTVPEPANCWWLACAMVVLAGADGLNRKLRPTSRVAASAGFDGNSIWVTHTDGTVAKR